MKLKCFCRAVCQRERAVRPLILSLFVVLSPLPALVHHVGGSKDALAAAPHGDQHPGLVMGGSWVCPCFPTDPPVNVTVRKGQIIVLIVRLKKKKKALSSLTSYCYSSSQIPVKMKKGKPSPSSSNLMKCSVCAHKHWMPLRAQILLLL